METLEDAIVRCKEGDLEPFTRVYDAYVDKVYRFIYYKTLHRQTAEDLTSATFLKAIQHLKSFQTTKGTFQAWIYKIARNTVIDHYRSRKEQVDVEDFWDLASKEDVEHDVEVYQQLEDVEEYLFALKPKQREIMILRIWNQLSYKEIAAILNMTEANAKMTFSRVLRELRKQFGAEALMLLALTTTSLWLQR
ncbi:sigma-70 family RNA polymerase sigma factor [Candidatus Uhrbacteria bacterium]|nr:sigma-70 family RNA polymerase sigma factor [Candidatus Uhrbacteria bacterium]MBD3284151.1 sigma-70 family RNA polymerase sigma factor [Candidatus Uhrbacteria bacterium]